MSDLISRERLINEWDDLGRRYAMPTTPIHKRAFREFPSADREKGEWIPTIERLPEIGDTVLCSVKTPECTDHHIIICKYCAEEFWKDGTIRAWQPLPEPYKAECEDMRGGKE